MKMESHPLGECSATNQPKTQKRFYKNNRLNIDMSLYLIYLFLFATCLIYPVFLIGPYFSIFYLTLLPFVILKRKKWFYQLPTNSIILYLFLLFHVLLMIYYQNDHDSFLNLLSLFLSYLSLIYLVLLACQENKSETLMDSIFTFLITLSIIGFPVSALLTFIDWPSAPKYYPWEAFFSNKRLLLIVGQNVGHTIFLWLFTYCSLYLLHKNFRTKIFSKIDIILFIFFIFCLVETESRIAVLNLFVIFLTLFSYLKIINLKLIITFGISIFLIAIIASFEPNLKYYFSEIIFSIQNSFEFLRIAGSTDFDRALFTGRDILNQVMFDLSTRNPIFGLGDSHPAIVHGVSFSGSYFSSIFGGKVMTSESMWIMAAKYGFVYLLFQIGLILHPIVLSLRGYYRDEDMIFIVSISTIILLFCVVSVFGANLYSGSQLHVFLLLVMSFSTEDRLKMLFKVKKIAQPKAKKQRYN